MKAAIRAFLVLFLLTTVSCTRDSTRVSTSATVDAREAFARCLTDRGARLYSAHWCGYCQRQAELFGPAFARVTHIECSPPGATEQAPACREAGIEAYPTWVFANGRRNEGLMSLQELAAATGCPWTPP